MEGMRFTRNRQNTRSFGNFLAGNLRGCPSQVTSDSVSRSETCASVLFEIEIPCILLFLNRNENSQNSSKRMHPYYPCVTQLRIAYDPVKLDCGNRKQKRKNKPITMLDSRAAKIDNYHCDWFIYLLLLATPSI